MGDDLLLLLGHLLLLCRRAIRPWVEEGVGSALRGHLRVHLLVAVACLLVVEHCGRKGQGGVDDQNQSVGNPEMPSERSRTAE
jgi:hypothetical protein